MTTQDDFCRALLSNDRGALRGPIDSLLAAQSKSESVEARKDRLVAWIRAQPCVASAELERGFLEVKPPIQELVIELTDSAASAAPPLLGKHRTLGITHAPDRLHFDYR